MFGELKWGENECDAESKIDYCTAYNRKQDGFMKFKKGTTMKTDPKPFHTMFNAIGLTQRHSTLCSIVIHIDPTPFQERFEAITMHVTTTSSIRWLSNIMSNFLSF
jgi:hypothetical protein